MKHDGNAGENNVGSVVSVRGSVIDLHFSDRLPEINSRVLAGEDGGVIVIVEVQTHLDEQTVRGIAFNSTQGLRRGDSARDTDEGIQVPVEHRLGGRVLNVFGETIDEAKKEKGGRRSPKRKPASSKPGGRTEACGSDSVCSAWWAGRSRYPPSSASPAASGSTRYDRYSWTLMMLIIGVTAGCLNAWQWVNKESRDD